MNKYIKVAYILALTFFANISCAANTAQQLFKSLKEQVYQIRVVDIASNDKSSIGSGFLISKDGHIATNFHVVSLYVHKPDKYRIELVRYDESTSPAELLAIDIIHDLAIIKTDESKKFEFDSFLDKNRTYVIATKLD